jgi:hypothetical protein
LQYFNYLSDYLVNIASFIILGIKTEGGIFMGEPKLTEKIKSLDSQLAEIDNKFNSTIINVKYPPLGLTPAVGDGVTDDWSALQAIFNYAYDNDCRIYLPAGNYLISKPLIVYSYSDDYGNQILLIDGAGQDVSVIVKNNNTTLGTGEYATIDAIMIIANQYTKNGQAITNIWSHESITEKGVLSNFSLKSTATTPVSYGIYSYGLFFFKFFGMSFLDMNTAFATTRYCSFNIFEKLEVKQCAIGFNIWSDASGATTLRFLDIHLNGVTQYGYKIKGHAMFEDCSNDGGSLVAYYFLCSRATLINCHSESPACSQVIYADGNTTWGPSTITLLNCGIMTPLSTTNPTFQLNNMTTLHCIDLKITTTVVGGLPTTPAGKLYQASANSRMIFDNLKFIGAQYATKVNYSISENEKVIVSDRNRLNTPKHTYMAYVPGAVPSGEYNTSTVTNDGENLIFTMSGEAGKGYQGIAFETGFKMDSYSRLYMKTSIDFTNASGNSALLRILTSTRSGVNTSATVYNDVIKTLSFTADITDYEYWIDISDLYGTYYAEVVLTNIGTMTIKEIALLK